VQSTALGGKAIVSDHEHGVTFTYKESGTGERKTMTLAPREFLLRILSHVLPDGLHKVRYFGWLHPNARKRYHQVALLVEARIVLTAPEPAAPPLHLRCPHCGAFALRRIGCFPRPLSSFPNSIWECRCGRNSISRGGGVSGRERLACPQTPPPGK